MNLAHKFGKIFWNTACLTVNGGASEDNNNNSKNKNTNYGKIAKAIGEIQGRGQKMSLPNINTAHFSFIPNLEDHTIVFGLKGICGIGDEVAQAIIANRPYANLKDFYDKMQLYKNESEDNKFGDSSLITLIKSGAFDSLENKIRVDIMKDFARLISEPLKKLTTTHITTLNNLNLLTDAQKQYELRLYKFRSYLYQPKFLFNKTGKSQTTEFYFLDETFALPFFYQHFETQMVEDKDYVYTPNGEIAVKRGSLDREFKKLMTDFTTNVLQNTNTLNKVNDNRFLEKYAEIGSGSVSKWEMDSLSFYYTDHELANIDREQYMISSFEELPEVPKIAETYFRGKRECKRFTLCRICGTILDTDKNKDTITLLTPDSGVISVKYYKGQFGFYNKQISHLFEGATKKVVLEKSWFKRGNKLLVTGYRRGERFYPTQYANSAFRHTTQLIKEVLPNGLLKLQSERIDTDEL